MSDFKIFEYEIHTAMLPAGTAGPTFCMLADLHNHEYGPGNGRLVKAICAVRPDAVLVAGDLLVGDAGVSYQPALRLMQRLREEGFPVFYGCGNHEYRLRLHPERYGDVYAAYAAALQNCGVTLLENETADFTAAGLRTRIYGFELAEHYYRKFSRERFREADLTDAFGTPQPGFYHILLAHNPVYFDAYARWGADLTLSGHLHGGIIRLPFLGGLITPQARLFPRYDAGHFQREGKDLVVSRGLGTHTVNLRIFNPAELSVIHLKGA